MINNVWGKLRELNDQGVLDALAGAGSKLVYCDYTNGSDTAYGNWDSPLKTLEAAYDKLRDGKNDVVVLLDDGTTAGSTIRIDAAFTWAKNNAHLIAWTRSILFSQRGRLAPTASTTAFAAFFTVSGKNCLFRNIQFYHGFTSGVANSICVNVSGERNLFQFCQFAGMMDATSAQSAGSRSLKVGASGRGENLFEDCVIGADTVARTVANASLELAGGTARNVFRRCIFPFWGSSATILGILGTGASCIDRETYFEQCSFTNAIKSGSTGMTAVASLTNASPGGMLVFRDCMFVGATKIGDATAMSNSYIDMAAPSTGAGGLGVNPS
tara:strand:+ start:1473 stop:2453 length:981 start_codon:yes stop_codon:yes gene_type:complete